ncbi:unnamed protein product [Meganyctiphanes norvegica]|uniref:Membrane insertase YidC/Oxa/ALB C-terminal domain-containing protein n=1 Tax=Meganyctiphanes norvegica TaxID=48144 RepID=A0AAV2R380_MEGNR
MLDPESAAAIGADLAFSETAQVAVPDVAEINVQSVTDNIEYIPAPPVPVGVDAPIVELTSWGEPTLQSMGLASWWPSGWMQSGLENIHCGLDLPWWGTIALATVCIRCLLFPLVIKAQKNGAKMANHMPQMQILQMKITEARNSGNQMEAARISHELANFYKEKDISIGKTVMVPLAQAPIFMSMFFGLRGMANLPVESMKTGGMYWFTDLTVADPYFALPIITSLSLLASIELGVDGTKLGPQSANVKLFLRALPIIMLPFTYSFPTAVLCYWVTTNTFSLVQVGFLKIPRVREYFKIPVTITHKPGTLPPKKGVVQGFKDSWANQKIVKEIEERAHFDEMRFKRAGQGPVVKTYKHNPTLRSKKIIDVKPKLKK